MKFGGTSVGTAGAIRRASDIVADHTRRREDIVVVVSAMRGITEALLKAVGLAAEGRWPETLEQIDGIAARNLAVIRALFSIGDVRSELEETVLKAAVELTEICLEIHRLRHEEPYLVDAAGSLGERLNARIVAARLRAVGLPGVAVDATALIRTDRRFLNATPKNGPTRRHTRRTLLPLLAQGLIPVVTGFIGAARDGRITTLGRGGSDYTASILGACLDAGEVWIWTDVPGVMTADPRLVPEAAVIPRIGFADVHELAHFGGRVLHPRTIRPVRSRNIPIRVLNTFDPTAPGTRISRDVRRGSNELVVTLLAGVRRPGRGNILAGGRDGERQYFRPVGSAAQALRMASQDPDGPVSVVSMVGGAACSRSVRARAVRTLDRCEVAVYGSQQARRKNRFSLIVPEASAHQALRAIHKAVVTL
jgi:aspartate kinase